MAGQHALLKSVRIAGDSNEAGDHVAAADRSDRGSRRWHADDVEPAAPYQISFEIERSAVTAMVIQNIDSGELATFPREVLFRSPDMAGLFAAFVERRAA